MPLFSNPTKILKKILFEFEYNPIDWKEVEQLIKRGADPNVEDVFSYTPLMFALVDGPLYLCSLLIEKGANVNHINKFKETVLHIATQRGDLETCRYLLKKGAKETLNQTNSSNKTVLGLALLKEDKELCKLFINEGIKPSDEDLKPVFISQNLDLCELLLQYGVNLISLDKNGQTPLMFAIQEHNVEMIDFLLKYDANINVQNSDSYTALIKASLMGLYSVLLGENAYTQEEQIQLIWKLVEHGADLTIREKNGKTAEELVRGLGFKTLEICLQAVREKKNFEKMIPKLLESQETMKSKTLRI